MRKKKFTKLFVVALSVIVLSFVSILTISAATEYEWIYINGTVVSHYNTGGVVTMPTEYVTDIAEMRGAWVATVWNEDMPKQKDSSEKAIAEYKACFLDVLDTLEKYNMNQVFFQIRPSNDAFYRSELNDWSSWLIASRTDPGWDPMEWMIEEAHKRNIYFFGWMNAFRVTTSEGFSDDAIKHSNADVLAKKKEMLGTLTEKNWARQHPECVVIGDYDSKLFLNPSDPTVHQFICDTLEEIARNYDIDGFHFDDYFYPSARSADMDAQIYNRSLAGGYTYDATYTGADILNDLPTYEAYKANPEAYNLQAGLTLGQFRRGSITNMMRKIRAMVDTVNTELGKHVEYGTKPAAVWQSNYEYCHDSHTAVGGSNTHCGAYSSNYDLFADTKAWVEEGLVDWVAPQVYYGFQNKEVPYADIVLWWANVVRQTNAKREAEGKKPIKMYVAHGIYKYRNEPQEFTDANEMVYQVRYNTLFPEIKGDAVYAYCDLVNFRNTAHKQGIGVNLYTLWYSHPVLPIPLDPLDSDEITIDAEIGVKKGAKENHYTVSVPKKADTSMYEIYRVEKGETLDLNDTSKRIGIEKTYKYDTTVAFDLFMKAEYDYYLVPVSNNNYPSKNAYKFTCEAFSENRAPSNVEITINGDPASFKSTDVLNISFPYATDADNDALTYKLSVSLTGMDGSFSYNCDEITYGEDGITAVFYPFSAVEEFVLKVEVSDGTATTVTYYGPKEIIKEEKPVNPPVNPPEEEDDDDNKGGTGGSTGGMNCSFGASLIPLMSLFSLSFILLKRRH